MSPDPSSDATTDRVQSTLLARYAPALLMTIAALVPASFVWGITYFSVRTEIAGKAPQAAVDAITRELDLQTKSLKRVERRQLMSFCVAFPQSFECQPSERIDP